MSDWDARRYGTLSEQLTPDILQQEDRWGLCFWGAPRGGVTVLLSGSPHSRFPLTEITAPPVILYTKHG